MNKKSPPRSATEKHDFLKRRAETAALTGAPYDFLKKSAARPREKRQKPEDRSS